MKRAFRDAWVAKLRSGEVEQAQEALCVNNKRCCLGVAYMIDDCNAEIEEYHMLGEPGLTFDGADDEPLEDHISKWGLSENDKNELIRMNDGIKEYENKPQSFDQIADWIEKNIPVED